MNKLVSRNPVLRFKEGKKIIFAETGIKTFAPTRGTKFGDWMRKQTSKGFVWLNSKDNSIIQPGLEILVDGLYLKGNGTYTSASLRNKKNENVTGTSSKTNNFDKTRQSVNDYADKLLNSNTTKVSIPVDNYYLKGFEKRKDEIAKLGGVRAVLKMLGFTAGNGLDGKWGQNTEDAYLEYLKSQSPNNIKYTPGIQNDGGFTPIGETTTNFNVAKEYLTPKQETTTFNLGTYVGDPTRTYNAGNIRANRGNLYSNVNEYWDYLSNNKNSDDFQLFLNIMGTLDGSLNREAFDAAMAKYGISGNLGRRDSGRLANLLNDLRAIGTEGSDARNAFLNSYKLSFDNVQTGVGNTIYDRSATREWLRNNAGGSAYAFTGDLRKAVRNILNGLGTDQDKELIKGNTDLTKALTGYFKIGGTMNILPSRNIVERFKLGRKIEFLKGGRWFYNGKEVFSKDNGKTFIIDDKGNYVQPGMNRGLKLADKVGKNVYKSNGKWFRIGSGKEVKDSEFTKKSTTNKQLSIDRGSSEVDRFAIASKKGETRYFKTKEAAKAYQKTLPQGSSVFRDNVEEARGQVLKANRTSEKATEYGRKLLEKNNNLSFKLAYQEGRKTGNKYFAWRGAVYKTDLENGKDNKLEMEQHYGDYLGFQKNPNLLNNPSREARKEYRKGIGTDTNRNANYKGETNSQGNARADKNFNRKLGISTLAPDFIDAVSPQTAIGNFMNMAGSAMTGEHFTPRIYLNGFNVPGYASDLALGKYKDLAFRGLDAYLSLGAPGARINMTPGGTNVTEGATLLPNGTRTFSKWHLNALGPNAEKIGNNILRSSKGTQYYIDNGQYMKNLTIPALLSNPIIQLTLNLEK